MDLSKIKVVVFWVILITFFSNTIYANNSQWFDKGKQAFKSQDYKNAIDYFGKSLNNAKSDDSDKLIYYYRAMSYLYLHKVENAIVDFNTIIKLDSKFPDAYNSRGLCYGFLGKVDKAIDDFNLAIKLDSNFSQAYINLGSAFMAQKKYKLAKNLLDKAIEIDSSNAENYYLRATLLYQLGQYNGAIKDFTQSINNGLVIIKNYYSRGNAYFKLKKYLEAIKDYSKVIELDTNSIDALNNRAASYVELGLEQKADEDRLRMAIISAGIDNTPDVKTIKFKEYKFLNSRITINLPSNWFTASDTTRYGEIKVIAKDTIHKISNNYLVGVRISLDSNMTEQFKVKSQKEILDFWEKSTQMNTKSYIQYSIIHKEDFKINGFVGYLKTVSIVVAKESFPIRYYELVLVKGDVLFYAYLQSPEIQFAYYKQIFDKAIKSIKMKY